MKITNQKELDKLIATADKSNTIVLNEDLEITFDCEIPCHIKAYDIKAYDINADNIEAYSIEAYYDIKACNIDAYDIKANNIDARNINAYYDIKACNINADNIKANNIYAHKIEAYNIKYFAFCIAYESLKCESISGTRENSFHKCLDQEIEIVKKRRKSNDRTNTKPIR